MYYCFCLQNQIFLESQTYPDIIDAFPQYHYQHWSDHYAPQDARDNDGPKFQRRARDIFRVPLSQHGDRRLIIIHDSLKYLLVTSQVMQCQWCTAPHKIPHETNRP